MSCLNSFQNISETAGVAQVKVVNFLKLKFGVAGRTHAYWTIPIFAACTILSALSRMRIGESPF